MLRIDLNHELLVRARTDPEAIGELCSRHARALERCRLAETRASSAAAGSARPAGVVERAGALRIVGRSGLAFDSLSCFRLGR